MTDFESGKTIETGLASTMSLSVRSGDDEDDVEEFDITGATIERPSEIDELKDEAMKEAVATDSKSFYVEPEVAAKTFERVAEEIGDARNDGVTADQIVLGVEQYKAVCVHMNKNCMGSETVEEVFGLEVIVVPGPMMFVPRDKRRMLFEYGAE